MVYSLSCYEINIFGILSIIKLGPELDPALTFYKGSHPHPLTVLPV